MSFLYHYHAEYRTYNRLTSIDGIASLVAPVCGMDDYHNLKSVIVRDIVPAIPVDQLVVTSLTPLGEANSHEGSGL